MGLSRTLSTKGGSRRGSAHGGASPLLSPQGPVPSGLAPFFPGQMTTLLRRAFSSFPLLRGSLPVSAFPFPSPALTGLFFGMRPVLHASPRSCSRRVSPRFFSPSLRPVFVFLCSPQIRLKFFPSLVLSLFVCTHGLVSWHGMRFPCLSSAVVFPQLSVASFPFLVRFSPPQFDRISPGRECQHHPRSPCVSGSTTPSSGVRFCGPRCCRSSHHTTSQSGIFGLNGGGT